MSSLLSKYAALEQQARQLQSEMERLESDQRFKAELEFKDKLEGLMREFDKSGAEVIGLLNPQGNLVSTKSSSPGPNRRKRKLKVYKNPNTGEVVETRGANQKTLKAWKAEFGDETVEGWLVRVDD